MYVDVVSDYASRAAENHGGNCLVRDVTRLPDDWDKVFDLVLCSHVLEHVSDPLQACRELSRVAKAGVIVCPSPMTDALFAIHEPTHRWWVWPVGESKVLRFQKIPEDYKRFVASGDMSGVAHRLYRLGPARLDRDSCIARRWFHRAEPALSVVLHWSGEIKAEIVD